MKCKHDWELIDKEERDSPMLTMANKLQAAMGNSGRFKMPGVSTADIYTKLIYLFKCSKCKKTRFEEKKIGG